MNTGNLTQGFSAVREHWTPKVMAAPNGQEIKLVKAQGDYPWHLHEDTEEMFLVWKGTFQVHFRDRVVKLGPGDFVVIPPGVEHRMVAEEEAEVLLFEPPAAP